MCVTGVSVAFVGLIMRKSRELHGSKQKKGCCPGNRNQNRFRRFLGFRFMKGSHE